MQKTGTVAIALFLWLVGPFALPAAEPYRIAGYFAVGAAEAQEDVSRVSVAVRFDLSVLDGQSQEGIFQIYVAPDDRYFDSVPLALAPPEKTRCSVIVDVSPAMFEYWRGGGLPEVFFVPSDGGPLQSVALSWSRMSEEAGGGS